MPISTALASFFLIWWVVLFAVLPWGVRSQHEGGEVVPGTDPGAPMLPKLGRKLLWTTLVSLVVFAGFYVVYVDRLVTLEGLLAPFGLHMTRAQ
jgi:predicted secreted protein